MRHLSMRRAWAGVLLALLLCGPLGPLGAQHVAHVAPPAVGAAGVNSLVAPAAVVAHDSRTCPVCHLLTGLRWAPVGQVAVLPATGADLQPEVAPPPVTSFWLGDAPSSRGPPLS